MEESNEIDTSIATTTKLDIDEPGSSVDQKLYRANPNKSHLTVVKRILRYLKGIVDHCLWYPKGSNFNLVGFADADYVGFLVDRKSTSSMAYFLGSCLVSWTTKKQKSVVLSTAEAEYVVAASYCAQLLWIKQQLMDQTTVDGFWY
ncbi:uncharacterized mitochondrial protein AtMg00810-like [Nicotiana sylvestris]|uniref:uncharacterized mitochondrial protein AtMg00810-like n=1 Tax=Nicotiana sylvestris TaxID=4096 RepID=UPI00388C551F